MRPIVRIWSLKKINYIRDRFTHRKFEQGGHKGVKTCGKQIRFISRESQPVDLPFYQTDVAKETSCINNRLMFALPQQHAAKDKAAFKSRCSSILHT